MTKVSEFILKVNYLVILSFLLVINASVALTESISPRTPEFLFVVFDAGETHALLPVMQQLERENFDFLVLTLGTSRTLQIDKKLDPSRIIDVKEWVAADVNSQWDRYRGLNSDDIDAIFERVKPHKVVTGVSSEIQYQLVKHYAPNAKIFAYFDNFGPVGNISYAPIVRKIEAISDVFLVPSRDVAATSQSKNPVVVGQPSLEFWVSSALQINPEMIKQRLDLDKVKPIIIFIGGYDQEYSQVFTTFIQGVKTLASYQIIIRPHPKTDGSVEQKIIQDEQCNHCYVSMTDMNTMEAVSISDVIVCHHSTVGIQALFTGKKIIYIDLPDATFTNPDLSSWKLSKQVTDKEALIEEIHRVPNIGKASNEWFTLAGIPQNSVDRMVELLTALGKDDRLNHCCPVKQNLTPKPPEIGVS